MVSARVAADTGLYCRAAKDLHHFLGHQLRALRRGITTSILRSRNLVIAALEVGRIASAMAIRPITWPACAQWLSLNVPRLVG
jgi:hypothetical protein